VRKQPNHINRKAYQKQEEPLVVTVAQTVVDKYAVMIKLLNASVAEIAVIGVFRSQSFAGHAHVIKMVIFSN